MYTGELASYDTQILKKNISESLKYKASEK